VEQIGSKTGPIQTQQVHSGSGIDSLEWQANKRSLFAFSWSDAYFDRAFSTDRSMGALVGYGFEGSANSNNRDILETAFALRTILRNGKATGRCYSSRKAPTSPGCHGMWLPQLPRMRKSLQGMPTCAICFLKGTLNALAARVHLLRRIGGFGHRPQSKLFLEPPDGASRRCVCPTSFDPTGGRA